VANLGVADALGESPKPAVALAAATDAHPAALELGKMLDICMLVIGGKQRTRQEYTELLSAAGFRFTREIDTDAGLSIVEAIPV
jgi:hypothetical protein